MSMTVLNVAFPFAPVGPDAVGGAEQILSAIDSALIREGYRSVVVACEGSSAEGSLITSYVPSATLHEDARIQAHRQHRDAIEQALHEFPIDVIHMHGLDFISYLPKADLPVLATLHLPPAWYPSETFTLNRPETYLQCVSSSQLRNCPWDDNVISIIENGVPLDHLQPIKQNFGYAIGLGRICPEKGFHLAALAARKAKVQLFIGGMVFGYEAHVRYFRECLEPLLDGCSCRFIGNVKFRYKRLLLAGARCLLVPSLVPETSSLVAMEALACGTPVITFGAGALKDIVEHGKTGFVVTGVDEMAEAIHAAGGLDRAACRAAAEERFSAERMTHEYLDLYGRLVRS